VIVLEPGTVAARGRHAWLLAHHDGYRDAWAAEQGTQG
jgi:ABC-type transport system involved in Fe-S cluster assembly fused permease/ATPase subunit